MKEKLMSIRTSIEDFLQDTIFEMAYHRKELLKRISDRNDQVAINLIKIAFFGIRSTWDSEYETLIENISNMLSKNKGIILTKKQYYDELFDKPFEPFEPWNDSYVYKTINSRGVLNNKRYNKLTHIQINKESITLIHNKIKDLIMNVSGLLADRSFDIIKFQNLTEEYVKFWMEYKKNY